MVCLLAAPWVQLSVSAGNWWPHNALRHHWHMPISCHFRDCKALLVTSLTYVSGAIASVQTFTFTLNEHTCLAAILSVGLFLTTVTRILFIYCQRTNVNNVKWCWQLCPQQQTQTSSSAVAERPRDALCLSVVSFNGTIRRAQSSIICYSRFRFTAV